MPPFYEQLRLATDHNPAARWVRSAATTPLLTALDQSGLPRPSRQYQPATWVVAIDTAANVKSRVKFTRHSIVMYYTFSDGCSPLPSWRRKSAENAVCFSPRRQAWLTLPKKGVTTRSRNQAASLKVAMPQGSFGQMNRSPIITWQLSIWSITMRQSR